MQLTNGVGRNSFVVTSNHASRVTRRVVEHLKMTAIRLYAPLFEDGKAANF